MSTDIWYEGKEINGKFTVIDIKPKSIYLQDIFQRRIVLWKSEINEELTLYQKIDVQGHLRALKYLNNKYYLSHNIHYAITPINLNVLNSSWNFRNIFFTFYTSNYNGEYNNMIIPLIFGFSNGTNSELFDSLKEMGTVHLIIVSGLHFTTVYGLIRAITYKFDKKYILCTILITIYFFFVKSSISVFRAYFFLLGKQIISHRKLKNKISMYQILFWISTLYLLIYPAATLSLGYWLSYILTYSIVIYNNKVDQSDYGKKLSVWQKLWKILSLFTFAWLISSGIIILNYQKVSLLSFAYILVLTPIFEFLIIFFILFFPFYFIVLPVSNTIYKLIFLLHSINLTYDIIYNKWWNLIYVIDYLIVVKYSLNYKFLPLRKV
ncbi:ComEC/Rec2 family competence protein [Mycoplasmopsis verecunda]|uniref:Competence protein n=1 Tax=Mycoplasmopsis verecunda TaxID=171291 RepID=A0A1T4KR40_9BACT|nr:ComEC/Rec2 family competence protein [Mycoplasmopsis verecunda]WPB54690.1 ComEC/Rec2 family competence protein [Mycoplasmopsis verecunda]SJZ44919.1 Competence protein [Mycoplasmopsis verecunda]